MLAGASLKLVVHITKALIIMLFPIPSRLNTKAPVMSLDVKCIS